MIFHQPSIWFLLLICFTPLIWWNYKSRRRRPAIIFSSVEPLHRAGSTWAARSRWIIPLLRTLAVILLIVCLARPQQTEQEIRTFSEGIAIQLVVDRSGSMRAMDFKLNGQAVNRLEVVKHVVENFIAGGEDLPGRLHDLIGIIAFASFPDSICPLTLDYEHSVEAIRQVEPAEGPQESGTAIGEAIALGVERLHSLEQRRELLESSRVRSKVMILLTDGENNVGEIDPVTAAEMAATFGIRIYTIGAGTNSGSAPIPVPDVFGRMRMRNVPVSIDEETLKQIAEISGGQYFRATDTNSLGEIYARIDELEKTEIEEKRYVHFSELAVEALPMGSLTLPPLLLIVFLLLALEMLLVSTKFRTIP